MKKTDRCLKRSIVAGIISFVIVFVVCFISIPQIKDHYVLELTPASEENKYHILYHDEKTPENAPNVYTLTPIMYLTEDTYTVEFQYSATEDISVYVYHFSEYDIETESTKKYLLGTLESGKDSATFEFTLDDIVKQLILVMDYQGTGNVKLEKCSITSNNPIFNNRAVGSAFVALAIAFFVAAIAYAAGKGKKENLIVILLLGAMVAVSSIGLLRWDVVLGDDIEFHTIRLLGIAENIVQGAPFSKINYVFNGGYGYINNVFYPQIFLWPFAALIVIGADVICTYKLMIFAINIATVVISYVCFNKISNNKIAAMLATTVYALNYYRIGDIYTRAAVGELLYIVFFPLVMNGIYEIFHNREDKWYILAIGATCVLQSHIIGTVLTAVTGGILIVYYFIISIVKKNNFIKQGIALVKAGIAVVMLNIWFLVPILYYLRHPFTMFDHLDSVDRFYSYAQTLFDIIFKVKNFNYMTLLSHLGIGIGVLFVLATVVIAVYMIKNKKLHESAGLIVLAIIMLVATTSHMPWDKIGQIGIVEMVITKLQFSFRLNTVTMSFLSLAIAVFMRDIRVEKTKAISMLLVCFMVLIAGRYYVLPGYNSMRGYDGSFAISGISPPEYLMQSAAYYKEYEREDKLRVSSDNISVTSYESIGGGMKFNVENSSANEEFVEIPMLYYVGYEAESVLTGQKLAVTPGENYVIRVFIPQGTEGEITVKYVGRWFFAAADVISLLFAVAFVIYIKYQDRIENIKNKYLKTVKI